MRRQWNEVEALKNSWISRHNHGTTFQIFPSTSTSTVIYVWKWKWISRHIRGTTFRNFPIYSRDVIHVWTNVHISQCNGGTTFQNFPIYPRDAIYVWTNVHISQRDGKTTFQNFSIYSVKSCTFTWTEISSTRLNSCLNKCDSLSIPTQTRSHILRNLCDHTKSGELCHILPLQFKYSFVYSINMPSGLQGISDGRL